MELIKGGVYTINDGCYIVINDYTETTILGEEINETRFLYIKPKKYDLKSIISEVEQTIINSGKKISSNNMMDFWE